MRLLELVLQGVPGSSSPTKLRVGAGTTVIRPPAVGLPLGRLLAYALYDESVEPPSDLRIPDAGASRVAVTMQDHAGIVYRIVRDLGSGAVQLSRYQPESKSFAAVSSRAAEAGQYLRGQARLAAEDLYRDLLWLGSSSLPSRWTPRAESTASRTKARSAPVMGGAAAAARYEAEAASAASAGPATAAALPPRPGGLGGGGMHGPDPFGHLSIEERREKLAELERTKAALEEADDLQFTSDGKQRVLFEVDEKLKKFGVVEKEVESLHAALMEHAGLEGLEADMEAKIKEHDFLSSKLEKTFERVEEDRQRLDERQAVQIVSPLKNRLAQGGIGAAVLFSGLGLFFEPVRWLLLLNPVALGVVAFTLLEWIGDLEEVDQAGSKRAALDERAEQATRQFEMETTAIRLAMNRAGVESIEGLQERLKERARAKERYEKAGAKLAEMKQAPEYAGLEEQRAALESEIEEIEERLRASNVAGVSPMDLMREIEGLRASIDQAEATGTAESEAPFDAPGAFPGAATAHAAEPSAGGAVMPDPGPVLLSRLGDALLSSPSEVGEKLQPRVTQFAAALTAGRLTGVSFTGKGGTFVFTLHGGGSAGWDDLSPVDRDLVYLSARLAFAEAVLRNGPQPFLLEAPFDGVVDQAVWPNLAKIVRHLGSISQALHQTAEPYWSRNADALIDLSAST